MIELTEEQQLQLRRVHEFPQRVYNPSTKETLLLIHPELYKRVRRILEEEDEIDSIREMYPLVIEAIEMGEREAARE